MGTFWKAFAGKILASLFLAVFGFLGLGPDKWAEWMIQDLPQWVTPSVARTAFLVLAVISLAYLAISILRNKKSSPPLSSSAIMVPDWPIRDLCYRLRPDIHPNGPTSVWDELQLELFDKLSVGQLAIWGRRISRRGATTYGPLEPIPKEYWRFAHLNFVFLLEDREKDEHVDHGPNEPAYGDLQVNRAQAMAIWPQARLERRLESILRKHGIWA